MCCKKASAKSCYNMLRLLRLHYSAEMVGQAFAGARSLSESFFQKHPLSSSFKTASRGSLCTIPFTATSDQAKRVVLSCAALSYAHHCRMTPCQIPPPRASKPPTKYSVSFCLSDSLPKLAVRWCCCLPCLYLLPTPPLSCPPCPPISQSPSRGPPTEPSYSATCRSGGAPVLASPSSRSPVAWHSPPIVETRAPWRPALPRKGPRYDWIMRDFQIAALVSGQPNLNLRRTPPSFGTRTARAY